MKALVLSGALLIASVGVSAAQSYPITIMNCDRAAVFDHVPTNTVTFDLNGLEMLLALDLTDRIAGYTGVSGLGGKVPPEIQAQIADLPDIASRRFVVLDYGVVVPGPRAVEATKQFAADFAPHDLERSVS